MKILFSFLLIPFLFSTVGAITAVDTFTYSQSTHQWMDQGSNVPAPQNHAPIIISSIEGKQLIKWDYRSKIPAGATITLARLHALISTTDVARIGIWRADTDWDTTACWDWAKYGLYGWNLGMPASRSVLSTQPVDTIFLQRYFSSGVFFDITQGVKFTYENPDSNFGFLINAILPEYPFRADIYGPLTLYVDYEYTGTKTESVSMAREAMFSISPNPFNQNVRISLNQSGSVKIYNTSGRLVSQHIGRNITWDGSNEPNGVYLARIVSNGKEYSEKLILQR